MPYFVEIPGLEAMEKAELWEEARKMLYEKWRENEQDKSSLIRLASECWYVLVEWAQINSDFLDWRLFKSTLVKVTHFGLIHFDSDPLFLWAFGYMISINPALFPEWVSDKEFIDWENRAKEMLFLAHKKDLENPIFEHSYLGSFPNNIQKYNAVDICRDVLFDAFPNNTRIGEYFREMLQKKIR